MSKLIALLAALLLVPAIAVLYATTLSKPTSSLQPLPVPTPPACYHDLLGMYVVDVHYHALTRDERQAGVRSKPSS